MIVPHETGLQEALRDKWEKTGFLDGLTDSQKLDMAQLLDTLARSIVVNEKNTTVTNIPVVEILLPVLRRVMGQMMQRRELYVMSTPAGFSINHTPIVSSTKSLKLGLTTKKSFAETNTSTLFWNVNYRTGYGSLIYEAEVCSYLSEQLYILLDDHVDARKLKGETIYWYQPIGFQMINDHSIGFITRYGVSS